MVYAFTTIVFQTTCLTRKRSQRPFGHANTTHWVHKPFPTMPNGVTNLYGRHYSSTRQGNRQHVLAEICAFGHLPCLALTDTYLGSVNRTEALAGFPFLSTAVPLTVCVPLFSCCFFHIVEH